MNNLPNQNSNSNRTEVRTFFDKYFKEEISFPASQVDAVVGFFTKNGFGEENAKSTAIVLLNQARAEGVNIMELLDTLRSLPNIKLSQVVAQVLNAYREKTSILGYKVETENDVFESRNILI